MRLNANLLRIAHAFLRDADDAVAIVRDGALEGAVLAASNGASLLVLRDPKAHVVHSFRARLSKPTLIRIKGVKDHATQICVEDGLTECCLPTLGYHERCHVDSEYNLLDYARVLTPLLDSPKQATAVTLSAPLLGLLSKTAEELATHHGLKKTDASLTITAGGETEPALVRFSVPDAVAVVMPRLGDDCVPSIGEIARWAL